DQCRADSSDRRQAGPEVFRDLQWLSRWAQDLQLSADDCREARASAGACGAADDAAQPPGPPAAHEAEDVPWRRASAPGAAGGDAGSSAGLNRTLSWTGQWACLR